MFILRVSNINLIINPIIGGIIQILDILYFSHRKTVANYQNTHSYRGKILKGEIVNLVWGQVPSPVENFLLTPPPP